MKNKFEQIDQIFAEFDRPDSPGCALGLVQDGQLVYARGYGSANLDYYLPNTVETIFDIGSVSKQFTAISIAILARRGKLSLDDPIQKYLPEIRNYTHPITVRHLVHHTSGLKDYLELMLYAGMPFDNDYQEAQVVDLIARQKSLNFEPGSKYLYSNSGYFLLSEIVERASGKNLHEFARVNLFEPLGMLNTQFRNNYKQIIRNRATGYVRLPDGGFEVDNGIFDVVGDGAVFTNVLDLYRWDLNSYHNVLDGGGQELIEMVRTPGLFNDGKSSDYGFGLRVADYRSLPTVGHGGSWYGFRANLVQFPEQKFSVICLTNMAQMTPGSYSDKIADIWLEETFQSPLPQHTGQTVLEFARKDHEDKAGTYFSDTQKMAVSILAEENAMFLGFYSRKFPLAQTGDLTFVDDGGPLHIDARFIEASTTHGWKMHLKVEELDWDDEFQRYSGKPANESALAEYSGNYYSSELQTRYAIEVDGNSLKIISQKVPLFSLDFIRHDLFHGDGITMQFTRDTAGKLSGLSISTGRVKEVHFTRE